MKGCDDIHFKQRPKAGHDDWSLKILLRDVSLISADYTWQNKSYADY